MRKIKTPRKSFDIPFLLIVLALLAFGLTVLYSASTVQSYNIFGVTDYYIKHQLLYGAALGLLAMFACSKIDYHIWRKLLPFLLLLALLLLMLAKIPGFNFSSGGAARWIRLGPILFQPSELAKLAVIVYIAAWADKKGHDLNNFLFGLLPSLVIVGLFAALILIEPDFGTMMVLLSTAVILLFVAGINWRYFFWTIIVGALALFAFVKFEPYRARRLTTFLDPGSDAQGIGYQINQALLAIGSGSWFGYGYGLSRQKYNYLPQAMTDSVFAVLSEELGFFRELVVLGLFTALALRGFKIAKNAPDFFGKMLATGIVSVITLQALINIAAIIGLLPLTGIPLPFFSYGSTSLLVTLASLGIVLNISKSA